MPSRSMQLLKSGPGRPMKYGRASRAVTITLPEDVLVRLSSVDTDLGRAIVKLAERHGKPRARLLRTAEVAAYGKHAVILVNPAPVLRRLPGVKLVPIGDGRALISLDQPRSIQHFELDVRDALERGGTREPERQTLEAIADILRKARLSRHVSTEERTIIVLQSKRQRRQS